MLILGAGGFIGSHLVERLLNEGYNVVGIDVSDEKLGTEVLKQIDFFRWDIRNHHSDIQRLISSSDLVVDLIAHANPSIYIKNPLDVISINFFENLFVAETCIRYSKHLIQFSSCEVYGMSGGSDRPFSEEETPLILGPICFHRWIYACGKQFLERIIHAHGLAGELNYTIIRPFNFIGPKFDYLIKDRSAGTPRVFALFLSALLHGTPLYLVDSGSQRRSFTYISDAMNALMIIIRNRDGIFNRQICNIGNPDNETSIANLASLMVRLYVEISGKVCLSEIKPVSGEDFYGRGYQDCDRRIPDIEKLKRCGWKPCVNLVEALRRSMLFYLA